MADIQYEHVKRISLLVFLILFMVLLFWYSASFQDIFFGSVNIIEKYESGHNILAKAIFVGLAALSAMVSPFSSIPLVPVAVIIWGNSLTLALLLGGWYLGGVFTYLIGKYAAYPVLRRFFNIDGRVDYYRRKISPRSEFGLVLLFRLAIPAEIPGYMLGTIRYHFVKYFFATALAELPFAIMTVYASEALIFKKSFLLAILGLLGLILLVGAFYFFRAKLKQ